MDVKVRNIEAFGAQMDANVAAMAPMAATLALMGAPMPPRERGYDRLGRALGAHGRDLGVPFRSKQLNVPCLDIQKTTVSLTVGIFMI